MCIRDRNERTLVTTLTKRMAEELTAYLLNNNVKCNYIHSDVDTLERVKIMGDLREGIYDVLVGVNLRDSLRLEFSNEKNMACLDTVVHNNKRAGYKL